MMDLPVTRSLGTLAPVSRAPEARCDNVSSSDNGDSVRDNMMRVWELTVHTSALPGDQLTTESCDRDYTGLLTRATRDTGPGSLLSVLASGHRCQQTMSGQCHQHSRPCIGCNDQMSNVTLVEDWE